MGMGFRGFEDWFSDMPWWGYILVLLSIWVFGAVLHFFGVIE